MKYEVRTESGSIYVVDTTGKTWARVSKTSESGTLRTESGTYTSVDGMEPGQRMTFWSDFLRPGASGRITVTSEVCFVDRVDDTVPALALSVHTNHLSAVSA